MMTPLYRRTARFAAALVALTLVVTLTPGATPVGATPPDGEEIRPSVPGLAALDQLDPPERVDSTFADPELQERYDAWTAERAKSGTSAQRDDASRVEILLPFGSTAADEVKAGVEAAGGSNVVIVTDSLLAADVPFASLEKVQELPGVQFVRMPVRLNAPPDPQSASATGGGLSAQRGPRGDDILTKTKAKAWHKAGVTGKGVKVGIIDYFHSSYWNGAVAAGEIASGQPKGTFCRSNGASCPSGIWNTNSAHGTAVAEVISDLAPGVDLYIATAYTTEDTKAAVDYFHSKGVKIISRSLAAFLDGPGNGTGPSADVLNYAVSKGMVWLNSAGNHGVRKDNANNYFGGYWRATWRDTDGDGWLEYQDPRGIVGPSELMPVSCGFLQGLRWNDWGSNRTDYDLYAFDLTVSTTIASSANDQAAGAPPIEGASFNNINCSAHPFYYISVKAYAAGNGTGNDTLELMTNGPFYYYASNSYSATQPFVDTKNPGGVAVGAVDPVGGTQLAPYSSRGPTNDGRIKPDLSAGSNMLSYAYSAESGRFNGTSAATPVVAGAAALVRQADTKAKPATVAGFLVKQATTDRGRKGADTDFGTGELVLRAYSSTPTITGTAKVRKKLTAKAGTWGPRKKVKFTYRWYRNGKAISGKKAKKRVYKLVKADRRKKITVRVTGSQTGFSAVTRVSAAKTVK